MQKRDEALIFYQVLAHKTPVLLLILSAVVELSFLVSINIGMIVRKYGRRSRDLTGSYSEANSLSDVVTDSPSQEFSQDVYNFTLSPQDSARCNWSDPYGFNSSQKTRKLTILPPVKDGDSGDFDGGLWKPKKVKLFDVDSETYGSSSSQESREFAIPSSGYEGEDGILEFSDGGFRKPKKVKKVNSDPYGVDSSLEIPQRKGGENEVFEFSDGEFWESEKFKNVDYDSYGLNCSQESSELGISLPRKCKADGDPWKFDDVSRKPNKKRKKENVFLQKKKDKMKIKDLVSGALTSTLMETQEFGEMMEHVDEVNFALDGLKKGHQVTVRRASLLSLLSVCGTAQQRRILRVHGMAKTIIDDVLGLSFDDPPSNLAAAALFYILTSDGQDDNLLDSPNCIRFLLKLLKPISSNTGKENAPSIGSKLLGMCKNTGFLQNSAKGTDSNVAAISLKVHEMLINCKEIKPQDDCDNGTEKPELNPKWISLLTIEKACLSAISVEDSSGAVRKTGGNFKEKLREYGGLDAVFEEARKSHFVMEEWLEQPQAPDSKDTKRPESLVLLLKCLKIMENATFLSKDNQCHLLGMNRKYDGQQAPNSFTKLILSFIKILSGISLSRGFTGSSFDKKLSDTSNGCSQSGRSMEWTISRKSFNASQHNQFLICGQPESFKSCLEPAQVSSDSLLLKMRVESSKAGSCSGSYGNSNTLPSVRCFDSEMEFGRGKTQLMGTNIGAMDDSQDPFAFVVDDFEPSKWDLLSGRLIKSHSQESRPTMRPFKDGNHSLLVLSQQESSNTENHDNQEASCFSTVDEEQSILLADCLLTAVKVLMNLTNDNPEGCRQIANSEGLEILYSLIAHHFSSFTFPSPHSDDLRESNLSPRSSPKIDLQSNPSLSDQELDFLVAILGLLVNLVEKDSCNRARLAAASVSLPHLEGNGENRRDVISLLCSIFLANQGDGEAAGEEKSLSLEDEDSILQGEKEAEKMIVQAYAALLLAFLSKESKGTRNSIAKCLPKQNLAILVPVLERFVEFHLTLNMISPETHTAVLEVIESCRIH